jgi:hypothetical protein
MAQQTINYGTNPNDGTGDTLRGAFIKTHDNFTDLYDNKLSLTGTEVGAEITGTVTFDDDIAAVFQTSAGAGLGTEVNGTQIAIIGENGTSVQTSLTRASFNGNAGSIIKDTYTYGDGQQTFNYPTLGSTDNFNVNWPAKGGTVAFLDDISAGSGTVTSVAALTLGTTGTDLSSTVANGTTTPVITLNVPTASASNRGALSSTDWTTFNNKPTVLHKTGVASATHTGTTANTLISSFQIDANSIADNQHLELEFKANKINTTSGIVNYRIYINTSASLTGATLIGTYNAPSTTFTQSFSFRRLFARRSGTLLVNFAGDSAITDYTSINGAVIGSPTVDFTVNQFIIIAVQLAATGQQVVIESVLIQRI